MLQDKNLKWRNICFDFDWANIGFSIFTIITIHILIIIYSYRIHFCYFIKLKWIMNNNIWGMEWNKWWKIKKIYTLNLCIFLENDAKNTPIQNLINVISYWYDSVVHVLCLKSIQGLIHSAWAGGFKFSYKALAVLYFSKVSLCYINPYSILPMYKSRWVSVIIHTIRYLKT